jgi:6-phosphogluconolactonase (cycloisomerase 2 family)
MNQKLQKACVASLCLALITLLLGCGGSTGTGNSGMGAGNTTPGGTAGGSPSSPPEHLFWANPNSGDIVIFSIDAGNGTLTQTAIEHTGFNPLFTISSDGTGKFLYASGIAGNGTAASTIAYGIDKPTGGLTRISGSPFGFGVFFVNQVNSANFLYAADNITNQIHTIAIDPMSGALTKLVSSMPTGGNDPFSPRLNTSGSLLAVANQVSNNISVFTLDPNTGIPTPVPGSPFAVSPASDVSCPPKGGCGSDVAFVNSNLYYGNAALAATVQDGGAIFGFSVAGNGSLMTLTGSPFSNPGFEPQTLAATPDGRFLYVANAGGGVVGYSIVNSGALTLVPGSPQNGSGFVAVDSQSKFVYVGDTTNTNGIVGYSIDSNTGALKVIAGTPVGAGAQGGQIVIR